MTTYIVTEVVSYRVQADSEEAAVEHVIQDRERDSHCFQAVEERAAEEVRE